jgi:hypothetical protein
VRYFAVGPGLTARFLARMGTYESDILVEDGVCEGGVLIDVDRRRLLFFTELGAFDVRKRYAYRAVMLTAYAGTWAGWSVAWAHDGVAQQLAATGNRVVLPDIKAAMIDPFLAAGGSARELSTVIDTLLDRGGVVPAPS